ncbi:MAG: rhomboid family intramembrane serine protease [Phycisphaerales bacterium]|nr:rhomboid family intramembrane serine protease [Phycisphaerales bacterium]
MPDAHAGRKGKCKKCGSVIEIPRPIEAAQDPPDIYALADEPVAAAAPPASPSYQQPVSSPEEQNKLAQPCPSCMRRLEPGAKICVTCGIYVPSGRPVMTSRFVDTDELIVKAENIIKPISWLVALGIYPILSEAGGRCKPYATWGIAALTILVSIWFWSMEWSNSTSMRWAKNLMLWPSNAHVQVDDIVGAYSGPMGESYGDVDAMVAVLESEDTSGADEEYDDASIMAAYSKITPSQRIFGEFRWYQLVTHTLLHGDIMHLAGNLLFFVVFGSRVNAALGNVRMVFLYFILGILAAWIYLAMTPQGPPIPMLGASGAIMGMAGAYLLLFPVQKVFMAAWLRWGLIGGFKLVLKIFSTWGLLAVGAYIALDILYLALGNSSGVAHWAHVGGFLSGMVAAVVLLIARQVWTGCDLVSLVLGRWAWFLIGSPVDRQPEKVT